MTNFEKLKSMSIDELAKWLDENGAIDSSSWFEDFDNKYCAKCEAVMCSYEDAEAAVGFKPLFSDDGIECAYCEIYKKCRFFEKLEEVPDGKEMAKLWLKAEVE